MLTAEEFSLFRNLVYQECGMYFAEAKKEFLEYRIMKRMKATATATPYWYYRHVAEHRTAELPLLLELLTINETSFFRNMPQFELLRRKVLPVLAARKKKDALPRLRIWSAGCSDGAEPYTIAMLVLELLEREPALDVRILASDLSLAILRSAQKGCYEADKLRDTVPAELLRRHFDRIGEQYQVREQVRRLVSFDFHNLKHENGMGDLDVIFCRNVMIYFDDEERRRVVDRFYRSLNPGGYLFLGHSESLHGVDERFEFVFADKGAAYRKPERVAP